MATLPGATPLQSALSSLGARPDDQRAGLTKSAFDSIAKETSVPANVLIAVDEAAGGGGDIDRARTTATSIADAVRRGSSIEDAVTSFVGDAKRGRAVLDRAYDIADALYPQTSARTTSGKKSAGTLSTAADVGKTLAGAAISGAGMAVDAVGVLGDEAARALVKSNEIRAGRDPDAVGGETPIRRAGRWLGSDVIGGAGQAVSESASPEFREAMAKSSFKGDITSPSTWELPEDPSVAGTIGVGAQVAGSLIPVLLSGSARGAALIGGLMGGGEGVENGRKFVLDASKTIGDDGRPEIEKLPGYRELVAAGASPEQATAELVRRAENDAGFREGLISAAGGAVTNRIFHGAHGWLGTGGRLERAAKKAGAGFTEEGTQEVAENAAAQSGINAATGAETNIFDDSLQNFIAGGMGGGMAGAVGGATGRQPPRQTPPPPAPEPLGALPPPPLGLPAPTGPGYRPNFTMVDPRTDYVPNFTMSDPEPERVPAGPGLPQPPARLALPAPSNSRDTGAVGSDAGAVAAPGEPDLSAGGPDAAAMPAAPIGPIDAIAKGIAARTPAAAPAPAQRFPDQKPGAAIRLGDPETGEIVDGVFLRETPNGALVRLQGREVELTPEQFDAYRDTAPMIDAATKQAEKERAKNVEPRRPGEPTSASDVARPVSVLDDVAPSREGTVSSRTADQERAAPVPPLDEPRMPTEQDDQASEPGDARRVAVADGAANASADVGSAEAATQRAAALRREASRIRKQAKTPSDRPKEERRAEMRRADEMVREAAAIEDGLKAPPTTSAPRRAEWLRKRLAFLEGQAKASGWDARLLAQRQEARRELDTLEAKPDDVKQDAAPKRPNTPRDFWTYQADESPSAPPAGVAIAPEDWDTLSPGMRREIARDAARKSARKSRSEESEATDTSQIIDAAANEAATSPQNDLPEPTQAQKEAGNYKVGRVRLGGMDISIENPKGSARRGTDPNGKPWAVTMPAHYGYVRRTEGADGDHVDVYIGDHPDSDRVFVVDQHDANTGEFDEHKAILGTNSREEAVALYDAGFSDGKGPQRRRAVTEMTVPEFREWAESGDTKAPIGDAKAQNGDTGVTNPDKSAAATPGEGTAPEPPSSGENEAPAADDGSAEPAKFARVRIDSSPVVAEITGRELGPWADIRQLGRKAAAWYRQSFLGRDEPATVTNANTGWTIAFNKAGVGKIGGRKGEDIYKAVVALPEILERGVLVSSEPDNRGRPDIKAIHKIAATVKIDGREVPLVATVRETADGKFHYDLSRESEGGRNTSAEPQGKAKLGQPALEGASSDINIDFAEPDANPAGNDNSGRDAFPDIGKMSATEYREWAMSGDAKAIEAALREALDRAGIKSRVRAFLSSRAPLSVRGSYRYGWISIFRQGNSWRRTLDHEIVHALRDPYLWGGDYGLFTADEWRALVKAARRNDEIRTWVDKTYERLDTTGRSEEMVAEFYATWAAGKYAAPPKGPLARALERIGQFFRAVASAMRGEGFVDTADILEKIADGSIGRRQNPENFGPAPASAPPYSGRVEGDPETREQRIGREFSDALQSGKGRALGMIGSLNWAKAGKVFENWLTDAMGKHDSVNILSLVPGYSLFSELGKGLPGAQKYLRFKQQMDADRNELQARSAEIVDRWVNTARRDTEANDRLMDLMHDSTLAGIDPTDPDGWRRLDDIGATEVGPKASKEERERAARVKADMEARRKTWEGLKARYDKLPKRFQELYVEVRDEYGRMSDLTDAALMENIRAAASIAVKQAKRAHKKELQRIEDDGLTGQERADAIGKANDRLAQAMARNANSKLSKLTSLRQMFESNKLLGPYFPLARFGGYFATVRDASGKVVSFSRFETKAAQDEFIRRAEAEKLGKVEHGVLGAGANLKGMVDPRFVAEVETLLLDAGADAGLQDAIWQRWLETLPDQSMRKGRIHRKGRLGFDRDAIRAFSSAMFHGAHQLARLRYSLEMGEALNEAEEESAAAPAPERAGFVVREMRKRHEFTMSPTNNPLVTAASNLAFVWYLGASPATALVNLSQTTIVGVPVLAARFKKLGVSGATRQLGRALRDFGTGRGSVVKRVNGVPVWTNTWSVENSPRLTADEKRAMAAGYKRGVIDKTQSHDLASVAETGVEYNPTRERVMRAISFMFHHTERLNREVTYLAAYRMARADGLTHDEAVNEASGLTWKTHFDYQNTSRPRIMQSDYMKVFTTFRNFQMNMLFRLFRDAHQVFKGATAEERREARAQLIGVTLSLFAHAGIRGVWTYGALMTLLGLFLPGGADDQDEWLQDALLMNGDSPGVAAWNWTMGMALNGVPGTVLGIDLTNRIGMPDLYFRTPDKDLEGEDLYFYYIEQILGPVFNMASSAMTGVSMLADGKMVRGIEKMVPNAPSDIIKAGRWITEGVNTYYGDPIVENIGPVEALATAAGFTPARIAERYEINNRLKRNEKRITDERKDIHREIGDALRQGEPIPEATLKRMQAFNTAYPEFPITPKSIRQSVRAREQSSARNEFGVSLNPKLNARLREERAPTVYASNRSTPARPRAEEEATVE